MNKRLRNLILIPLFIDLTNIQNILSVLFIGNTTIIRIIAYGNIALVLICMKLFLKRVNVFQQKTPLFLRLWLLFFSLYLVFALLGNAFHNTIPYESNQVFQSIIFLSAYSLFLHDSSNIRAIIKLFAIGFLLTVIFNIYFAYLNFSLDHGGITIFRIDRTGGVYGDANNAALSSLLAFIFINYSFVTPTFSRKVLKLFLLGLCFYSLYLSFSKTSLIILPFIITLTLLKDFNKNKVMALLPLLPIVILGVVHGLSQISLSQIQKERLFSIGNLFTLETDKIDFSERDVLLVNMLGKINESPLIGWGVQYSNEIRGHNTIIGIWTDAGFLVFIFFLILLMFYLHNAVRQQKNTRYFAISVLICLYVYMLSLQTIINQPYIIVLFALLGHLFIKENSDVLIARDPSIESK